MVIRLNENKEVKIPDKDIQRLVKTMDIDEEEAVQIWLEDEGLVINEEQEELCKRAKENKSLKIIEAKAIISVEEEEKKKAKKKTQKERVRKENPTKEMIIANIANLLPNFATDVVVENKGKLITFKIGDNEFKLDLVQKRQKKGE